MRFTLLASTFVLAAFTACGDDGGSPATPDAPPDTPPLPATRITVITDVPAALVAFRDGDAPWQTAAFAAGQYAIDVHGPYRIAVVCDYGDGTMDMLQVARTPDDDREVPWTCQLTSLDHAVTGQMVQAGRVTLGFFSQSSTTPGFTFDVYAATGPHELVATTADRIAVRRAIDITGPTTITPGVDVDQQGVPLLALALAAANATVNETVSASIRLVTEHLTFARVFVGPAAGAKIAPSSVLAAPDRQRVTVSAATPFAQRSVSRFDFREGDSPSFTLPPPLGTVQFAQATNALTATWSTLPPHDELSMIVDSATDDFSRFWFHFVQMSGRYVEATGATSATVDTDIPGFKPEWRIDFATEYSRSFAAAKIGTAETSSSSVYETLNTPPGVAHRRSTEPLLRHKDLTGTRLATW